MGLMSRINTSCFPNTQLTNAGPAQTSRGKRVILSIVSFRVRHLFLQVYNIKARMRRNGIRKRLLAQHPISQSRVFLSSDQPTGKAQWAYSHLCAGAVVVSGLLSNTRAASRPPLLLLTNYNESSFRPLLPSTLPVVFNPLSLPSLLPLPYSR